MSFQAEQYKYVLCSSLSSLFLMLETANTFLSQFSQEQQQNQYQGQGKTDRQTDRQRDRQRDRDKTEISLD